MKKPMIDYVQKEKFDNLYTPEYAVYPIIDYIRYTAHPIIWECCDPGNSNITKVLKKNNYDTVSTDITTGFNFLLDRPEFNFDIIITNPPYSLKDEFIKKCMEYNKPFLLLLPITALEGVTRGKLFGDNGISIIVLNRRVDFTGKMKNWYNVSWFCHDIPHYENINNWISFESIERE